ncbi:MAG: hypothetical protein U0W40_11625 [Acidimicrobiia bacterium]
MRRLLVVLLAAGIAAGALGACGNDDAGASPYCRRIAEINGLDLLADPTPAAVRDDLEQLLALTRRAAEVAPDEIAADIREAVTAQVRFNDLYAKHGWDPTLAQQDPEFVALAGDAHLAEVYTRLERYEVRACPGDPSPSPSVAPA